MSDDRRSLGLLLTRDVALPGRLNVAIALDSHTSADSSCSVTALIESCVGKNKPIGCKLGPSCLPLRSARC
jgi:hypothetical protein